MNSSEASRRARRPSEAAVNSAIFWHFAKQLAPWLLATAVYVVLAAALVSWDAVRTGEPADDFGAELYGMYTQLFFEPTRTLPRSALSRAVFWVTPLLGTLLLARGVLRVGAPLFDPQARRLLWVKIMSDRMHQHVVVCGLGHVGVRVVEALKRLATPVVAIELRPTDSFGPAVEALGVPVIYGDARRDELLAEAGIARAKAVICATDHDLTNLEVAIDARRENPAIRVVMRMFDQRVAGKIGGALHLDETFSTSSLAGPLVALQATEAGVRGVYHVGDGTLRADVEIAAPAAWWGKSVAFCEDEIDGRIVGVRREATPFARARHDTRIEEGDIVTLDLPADNLTRLRRWRG